MKYEGTNRREFMVGSMLLGAQIGSLPLLPEEPQDQAIWGAARQADSHRRLFIDNTHIESARNLHRILHPPQRRPINPILMGTESWERNLIGVNGRAVLYDEEAQQFKMWYGAYSSDENAPYGQGYRVCYAVSSDGLNWTRPALEQVEWAGSRRNNLIGGGRHWMRRPNVIKDLQDPIPARRFKMTFVDVVGDRTAIFSAYSRDGIHWKTDDEQEPWFTQSHSANLLGWDAQTQRYVLFRRVAEVQQKIGRSVSEDFRSWSEPEVVLEPLAIELDKGFAGLAAFHYEGLYLGLLWVRDVPARVFDCEIAYSRDGISWKRVAPRDTFLARGEAQAWDSEGVLPVAPVVYDDKIWIYYSGWNFPYGGASLAPVQKGWVENGIRMQRAIGLATLRLDGFVSVDANAGETGRLTTKPIEAMGSLVVNADVRGEMRVELLDEKNHPLSGFSARDCSPIRSDNVRHWVRWSGDASPEKSIARPIKIRFKLKDASLYSFSFE